MNWKIVIAVNGTVALIISLLIGHPKPYGDLDALQSICNVTWVVAAVYFLYQAIKAIHASNKEAI